MSSADITSRASCRSLASRVGDCWLRQVADMAAASSLHLERFRTSCALYHLLVQRAAAQHLISKEVGAAAAGSGSLAQWRRQLAGAQAAALNCWATRMVARGNRGRWSPGEPCLSRVRGLQEKAASSSTSVWFSFPSSAAISNGASHHTWPYNSLDQS